MAPAKEGSEQTLGTLEKGLRVLEALAAVGTGPGLTLTELGQRLGMNRTTLFRFLVTLRANGYVERETGTDRYRLGVQVLSLASSLLSGLDIRHAARPVLLDLGDRTRELVHLAVLDGGDVLTIDRIEGTQPLSLQTGVGTRRPAYCTASGKAVLAHAPAAAVEAVLAAGMPPVTARTITSATAMRAELAEVRRAGFAVDDEERIEGVRCVAAPIFDLERAVVGAVSIAAPTLRMPKERVGRLGEEVCVAAAAVSRRLGFVASAADGRLGSVLVSTNAGGPDRRA